MRLTEGQLLKMHADALWEHDGDGRMIGVNQWDNDVSGGLAMKLASLGAEETLTTTQTELPRHYGEYLRLLGEQAEIESIEAGPAFLVPEVAEVSRDAITVSEENGFVLEGGLAAWLPDVPHRQPMVALVDGVRAVSVCCSVRITPVAHEAGVETLASHRGRGLGRTMVATWARAVRSIGALPLYSTSWDNLASRGLARSLGMSMYGVDFCVM
jgi:GNAT superfamily N-acetyltransferase